MIYVNLPWPPSTLSPNKSQHWAKLSKAKKNYKMMCMHDTISQIYKGRPYIMQTGAQQYIDYDQASLEIIFMPPQMRRYDRDNLVARMKSGIDGMCMAMKIDDNIFKTVKAKVGIQKPGGGVLIKIEKERDEM